MGSTMNRKVIWSIVFNMLLCLILPAAQLFATDDSSREQNPSPPDTACVNYLVEKGKSNSQIIIDADAPTTVMLAARELRTAVLKMSGVMLPVRYTAKDDIPLKIYVGRSRYTDSLGISSDGCRDGGYKMISGDVYLALIGDDEEYTILGPHSEDWSEERDSPELYQEWYDLSGGTWNNEYITVASEHPYMLGQRDYGTIVPNPDGWREVDLAYNHYDYVSFDMAPADRKEIDARNAELKVCNIHWSQLKHVVQRYNERL